MLTQLRRNVRQLLYHRVASAPKRFAALSWLFGCEFVGSSIVDSFDGIQLEYTLDSDIGQLLFCSGKFEEGDIKFIERFLMGRDKDPVVIDVGANVGLHSIRWAMARHDIRLFAFEPSPYTGAILARNIRRNGLDKRATLVPMAVSDCGGEAEFFICADDAYSSLKDTNRKEVVATVKVPITTLDEFVSTQRLRRIDLIKIDVEGFEKQAIIGAENVLRRLRPSLFVEIYKGTSSNPDPEGTIALIQSFGYEASVLENGTLTPYSSHSDSRYNYFFSPVPHHSRGN